ncbi:MAG: Gfo/Idh/MocA family oxidoreductase [Spirochaetales bacterium]|nr:Gfo/Idh/MocA family oxidoreductase [Spirochaetales bacterium]
MSIGFGIVGIGMIADFHAKALQATKNGKLIACYSRSQKKADAFGNKYNCKGYSSLSKFLSDPDVEVVSICTPSGAHMEPAIKAANAGKHVIIEKPIEVTLERCDRIINTCTQKGVICAGIYPNRFWDVSIHVKNAIDTERFEKLILGSAYIKYFRTQEYYNTGGWHGTWKYDGGGALMNQGIHAIDLLQWYMGPIESVYAFTGTQGHNGIEVEDVGVATIRFQNGALGVIEGSTAIYPGYQKKIEIGGTKGSVILIQDKLEEWNFKKEMDEDKTIREKFSNIARTGWGASNPANINYLGHQRQFEDFIEAIGKGRKPLVDCIEARKALKIIIAIYSSAQTGKAISFK